MNQKQHAAQGIRALLGEDHSQALSILCSALHVPSPKIHNQADSMWKTIFWSVDFLLFFFVVVFCCFPSPQK